MANPLATATVLLTDNIRCCLAEGVRISRRFDLYWRRLLAILINLSRPPK
jgi:hypothetical protein